MKSSSEQFVTTPQGGPGRGHTQFLKQDPVFWEVGVTNDGRSIMSNPQAMNSYGYGNSNPVVNKDPSGRCAGPALAYCLATIGAGAGARSTYAADVISNIDANRSSPYVDNLSTPSAYLISDLTGATTIGAISKFRIAAAGLAGLSSILQDTANNQSRDYLGASVAGATNLVTSAYFTASIAKRVSERPAAKVTGEVFNNASTVLAQRAASAIGTKPQQSTPASHIQKPAAASPATRALFRQLFPSGLSVK